jgi:hypothetical protein
MTGPLSYKQDNGATRTHAAHRVCEEGWGGGGAGTPRLLPTTMHKGNNHINQPHLRAGSSRYSSPKGR